MLMDESGWTVANPPETIHPSAQIPSISIRGGRTEELLGATGLLNNLNHTRLQLLNRGNVVGENTHLARLRGDVDLDDLLGLVDGLFMR